MLVNTPGEVAAIEVQGVPPTAHDPSAEHVANMLPTMAGLVQVALQRPPMGVMVPQAKIALGAVGLPRQFLLQAPLTGPQAPVD